MRTYRSIDLIKPGHTVGIFLSNTEGEEQIHGHDFIEILYITSGQAVHAIDDCLYDVERGDMLFINYGSNHAFRPKDQFTYINICFSPASVEESVLTRENALALLALSTFNAMRKNKNAGKISLVGKERAQMDWLTEQMLFEYEQDLPYAPAMVEGYFKIILTKMMRKTEAEITEVERNVWHELRTYIDEHPGEELTLGALAKKCFYNPSYFSRMFKAKFGSTLTEYVGKRRVQMAVHLLETGEVTTGEIIKRCGFSDRSAYSHVFAKYMGMSPAQYKEKVKKHST